jgi:hypothetical protein
MRVVVHSGRKGIADGRCACNVDALAHELEYRGRGVLGEFCEFDVAGVQCRGERLRWQPDRTHWHAKRPL